MTRKRALAFLRKWSTGESAATRGDYPIFMAIADTIGHNKRGKTLHKHKADGSTDSQRVKKLSRAGRSMGERNELWLRRVNPLSMMNWPTLRPAILNGLARWRR